MGYAVELYFDADAEARVVGLLRQLADQGITSVLLDIGARPHISLAVFADLEPPQQVALREELRAFAQELPPIRLALAAVGTFPTVEGVVFLAPTISPELVEAHRAFHERLADKGFVSEPYYHPGRWVPHCTVATDLAADKVPEALDLCRKGAAFGPIHLSTVGLVSFRPVREIYAFPLKTVFRK